MTGKLAMNPSFSNSNILMWAEAIRWDGFAIIPRAIADDKIDTLAAELQQTFKSADAAQSIRSRGGTVYAARNVHSLCPKVRDVWQEPVLLGLLGEILGPEFGFVRALFFDKPPDQSWSLPWHRDLTIAVKDNRLPSDSFRKPTMKAGVPHVEAPREVLEQMLTLRVHLDDVTDQNGPLKVIPGSHVETGETASANTIYASRGDVLAIRPLVSHSSANSQPGTTQHRRILHLEFAGLSHLPDGYQWFSFVAA